MIGGYFNDHPWHQKVRVNLEDRDFPAMKQFPKSFDITDEIYQFTDFSRDRVRVLISLDPNSVNLAGPRVHRTDKDFALTWVRNYGKGRVFYSALGHEYQVWDRPDIQKMWLEAVKWAMGMTPARLISPRVGLIPTKPLADDGQTTEPSVSVPTATAQRLAATAAPDPELDPQGLRSSA